jgi:GNAT superfamily N-acetyltransferase
MGPLAQTNIVYTRTAKLDREGFAVTARTTDQHPDGTYVEHPDAAWPLVWQTAASDRGILSITVSNLIAPDAPDLWFVRIDEPKGTPPAVHLVAFAGDTRPAGTVVNNYQFATMGVRSEEQAAAVRWYPRDGLVHQIYVAPKWRRLQVGTKLLYAAGALHQSMGWSGKLHSDGRRTPAGDALTSTIPHAVRIAALTETMPPMDPQ